MSLPHAGGGGRKHSESHSETRQPKASRNKFQASKHAVECFFSAAYQELSFGNTGAVFLSVTDIRNLTDNNSFLDRLDRAEMTLKVTQGH